MWVHGSQRRLKAYRVLVVSVRVVRVWVVSVRVARVWVVSVRVSVRVSVWVSVRVVSVLVVRVRVPRVYPLEAVATAQNVAYFIMHVEPEFYVCKACAKQTMLELLLAA